MICFGRRLNPRTCDICYPTYTIIIYNLVLMLTFFQLQNEPQINLVVDYQTCMCSHTK